MKSVVVFLLCAILSLQAQTFEVTEPTIAVQQKTLAEGRVTSNALVQRYLDLIAALNQSWPTLCFHSLA